MTETKDGQTPVNDPRTQVTADTNVPQARSGFDLEDTSRRLIALRLKLGARSPAGHRCSNLIEQLEKYGRTTDEWQQANLAKGIKEQMCQLAELTSSR